MDSINWKEKLGSRKFWCLAIACVGALGAAFGLSEGSVERVTSIIGAFATLIVYMLVEGNIDAKAAQAPEIVLDSQEVGSAIVDAILGMGTEENEAEGTETPDAEGEQRG